VNVIPTTVAADLDRRLADLRPKLHRYCARMVGSVIDGEDVVQDALVKAMESVATTGPIGNPEGWLFRIAHNTALDFLRRRNRQEALRSGEEVDMIADPADTIESRQAAAASLRTFMRLPVAQRGSVILMDVLGCSLQEICAIMQFSLPAAKAALHRGRMRLPASRTMRRRCCRRPIAPASAPMSTISTRATSTRSAI
jgi:RNA polymerase sigma-70 factor (ECF subfamily)